MAIRRTLHLAQVIWLVLLIALPCTAPFSTCELSDLMPQERGSPRPARQSHDLTGADRALPHTATAVRATVRVRTLRAATIAPGAAPTAARIAPLGGGAAQSRSGSGRQRHRVLRI